MTCGRAGQRGGGQAAGTYGCDGGDEGFEDACYGGYDGDDTWTGV